MHMLNSNMIAQPYIPEGRIIRYVSLDNQFMQAAKEAARSLSTDYLQPSGAVFVKDNSIIFSVANQSTIKSNMLRSLHQKGWCIRKMMHIKTGTGYWMCPGCATYKQHAESRGVLEAKRTGIDLTGADLYFYGHWWVCKPCWDNLISISINNIFLLEESEKLFRREDPMNILGRQFNH